MAPCVYVSGAVALLAASAPAATNAPGFSLVCDEPVFRFGTVSNQASVAHVFTLRNAGLSPAHIRCVTSSCERVVSKLERKDIPPGGETALRTVFALAGEQGAQRRAIRIMADDTTTPCLELWLEGVIVHPAFEPEIVNFGTVPPTDASGRAARLISLPADVRLTRTDIDSSNFIATITADGRGVFVRTHPPLPDGVSHATLRAFTDSARTPVVSVPVTATVMPVVHVMPAAIALPRGTGSVSRTVWVRPGRIGAIEVRAVHCPVAGMTATLTNMGAGIYRIDIQNIPVSGALEGKSVTVATRRADLPSIDIPFIFEPAAPAQDDQPAPPRK